MTPTGHFWVKKLNENFDSSYWHLHLGISLNKWITAYITFDGFIRATPTREESRSKQGQQWRQTTTEMVGTGNNQQNVAAAATVAETAVMATAIMAAWRQRRRWLQRTTDGDVGCNIGGCFHMARRGYNQIQLWRECWNDEKKLWCGA